LLDAMESYYPYAEGDLEEGIWQYPEMDHEARLDGPEAFQPDAKNGIKQGRSPYPETNLKAHMYARFGHCSDQAVDYRSHVPLGQHEGQSQGLVATKGVDGDVNHAPSSSKHYEETRKHNGILQYRNSESGPWSNVTSGWMSVAKADCYIERALYHHGVWRTLIEEAASKGRYRETPTHGDFGADDITSFHPDQGNWGAARQNRPKILFQYRSTAEDCKRQKPGLWFWKGCLMIDFENRPLRDFPELPWTLSSQLEGWRLAAFLRLNKHITPPCVEANSTRNFRDLHDFELAALEVWRAKNSQGDLQSAERNLSLALRKYHALNAQYKASHMADTQQQDARVVTPGPPWTSYEDLMAVEQCSLPSTDGEMDEDVTISGGTELLQFKDTANMRAASHDNQGKKEATAKQVTKGITPEDHHASAVPEPDWDKLSDGSFSAGHTVAFGDLKDTSEDSKPDIKNRPSTGYTGIVSDKVKRQSTKVMGRVRKVEGYLEWFDPNIKMWSYPMSHGKKKHVLDVTSFHPLFAENGSKREHWPEILFQYQPTIADFKHPKPPIWLYYDGRVIIDVNNDAMFDFAEIPTTLARNADNWLLTAIMRMNNHITLQDFRGRMMGGLKLARADPMGRNRLSMNMTRFRKFACCLTWNAIRERDTQRDYLEMKLPRRCHRLNCTKSFRELHGWEVAELDLQDAGKHLNRARSQSKDLSEENVKRVYARKATLLNMQKKAFEKRHPEGNPNDYDAEDAEYRKKIMDAVKVESVDSEACESPGKVAESEDDVDIVAIANKRDSDDGGEITIKKDSDEEMKPVQDVKRRKTDFRGDYVISNVPQPSSRAVARSAARRCPGKHTEYAGFLTVAPNDVGDAQILFELLAPSRFHFEQLTGKWPDFTEGDECYKCQHTDLQEQATEWHAREVDHPEKDAPMLVGLKYAIGEMLYWNSLWVETWFGPRPYVETLLQKQTDGEHVWACEPDED
ncbi:MAG: hypothetical protein Q9218_007057, partial [Villophora microphyllina]